MDTKPEREKNVYGTACRQNYFINMTVYQSVWNPLWLSTIQTGRLLTLKNVSATKQPRNGGPRNGGHSAKLLSITFNIAQN
jgi:hypothetical protein